MRPIHVGVIGCGYWGPQLIRNLHDLAGCELTMVADARPERLDVVKRQFPSVRLTTDHRRLLDDQSIESVVIATPVRTHYMLAKEALECGKHVLVEKPLAASISEAEELVAIADARDLRLMVGHTFEYNPAVEELRSLMEVGEIGRVHYIDMARLNLGLYQKDVNVLWDLAPHDLSILLYILQEDPITVSAHGNGCIRSDLHDVAYLELLFPHGVMAHIHVSWLEPCKVRRVTIVGDRKMVVYNDVSVEEKLKIYDKGVATPVSSDSYAENLLSYRLGNITSPRIAWKEPLSVECAHFVEAVRTGTRPRSDGRSGLRIVRILERADQSLAHDGVRVNIAQGYTEVRPAPPAPMTNGHTHLHTIPTLAATSG